MSSPEYHKAYREAHKAERAAANKAWRAAHKEEIKVKRNERQRGEKFKAYRREWNAAHPGYSAEWARAWRAANPDLQLLRSARSRAKSHGLEFNLTEEDVVIPEVCPILGIPLKRATGKRVSPNSPTLDRVDPAKGYVKGNVVVISHRANSIKRDASAEELRKIADYIDKHLLLN